MENEASTPEVLETDESLESTPEADGGEINELSGTQQEKGQIDFVEELKKTNQIPKGVEPFRDDNGELKFVIPINGKKYIANFKQVLGGFNLNQAGEQKLKAGKELEKKFNTILNNMSAQNPEGKKEVKKFLSKLGYDPAEIAEMILNETIEERSLSPEEREAKKRLAEIEEREAKLREKEEAGKMSEEQRVVQEKQQKFSSEIVNAMKTRKLDDVDPELKKTLMRGILGEMIEARHADYNLTAEEALDNVLGQFDLLLDNLGKLYGKEHLKKRLPKSFRDLVMKLSLEDQAPTISSSIHSGPVELDEYQIDKIKAKKQTQNKPKKINLSDW